MKSLFTSFLLSLFALSVIGQDIDAIKNSLNKKVDSLLSKIDSATHAMVISSSGGTSQFELDLFKKNKK